MALRDTIRELTSKHLDAGYSVMGQCLSAVGWVGNTLPERYDMVELPCSDVSGGGFAVGAALGGKRPILVIRYQGFSHFNAPLIVSYAAKSKEMWGRPCPMLIRGIAMEGSIGPVAGSSHHALWDMPGVKIRSPMTAREWTEAYAEFMDGDDVMYLSEHRSSWELDADAGDIFHIAAEAVLFPISITRIACYQAAVFKALPVSICPIVKLRPLEVSEAALEALQRIGRGVVLDDAHTGVAKAVSHDLARLTGAQIKVLGLEDRTAGFYRDNLPPDCDQIIQSVKEW